MHKDIGDFIAISMFKQNISNNKLAEHLNISTLEVDAILLGKYELDLHLITDIETFLNIQIISVT